MHPIAETLARAFLYLSFSAESIERGSPETEGGTRGEKTRGVQHRPAKISIRLSARLIMCCFDERARACLEDPASYSRCKRITKAPDTHLSSDADALSECAQHMHDDRRMHSGVPRRKSARGIRFISQRSIDSDFCFKHAASFE